MAITNYMDYLKQLEKIYNRYRHPVLSTIIRDFIIKEQLDYNFGITVQDVRNDLTTIHKIASNSKSASSFAKTVQKNSKITGTTANKSMIKTYIQYMTALENLYISNGRVRLTDVEIKHFISSSKIDTTYGITKADVKKDLKLIYNKWNQPVSNFTQKRTMPFFSLLLKTRFATYSQYAEALEKLYINKGRVIPTDNEIEKFIRDNKIDIAYGITKAAVKEDLEIIDRKWNPPVFKQKSKNDGTSLPQITTYKQYLTALKKLYIQNGKVLTDQQITKFITDEDIDVGLGITISDVKCDLQDIESKIKKTSLILSCEDYESALSDFIDKYGDKSFLNQNIKKFISAHSMDNNDISLISDIRMDLVFTQSKMPLVSKVAKNFKKASVNQSKDFVSNTRKCNFQSDFSSVILKHKDVFSKNSSIKGILLDYFPEKKREVNVLMILANYGMLEDMRLEQALNSVFISKYVTRIVNEYGVDKDFATQMAIMWCRGYGEGLLGKKIIC